MNKIAVITDSSCDFTPERAKKAGFSVVPLNVTFEDGTVYRDGVDLTSEEFFKKLAASRQLPKTSQPTLEAWMDAFRQYEDYDDIIVITVSSKLSGTINGAGMARRMIREEGFRPHIHLVDSQTASAAVAAFALEAVRMVKEGKNAQEILTRLLYLQNHLAIYFIIDSLEYLRKGGRIGLVEGVVGSLLQIKPVIFVNDDGVYQTLTKARGFGNALNTMCDEFFRRYEGRRVRIAIVHGAAYDEAVKLRDRFVAKLDVASSFISPVSPALAIHTGPGLLGAIVQKA